MAAAEGCKPCRAGRPVSGDSWTTSALSGHCRPRLLPGSPGNGGGTLLRVVNVPQLTACKGAYPLEKPDCQSLLTRHWCEGDESLLQRPAQPPGRAWQPPGCFQLWVTCCPVCHRRAARAAVRI